MGLFFSLVALLALILLAMVGAAVPGLNYVFGVIIPYAAIAAFIIGVIMRVVKWSKSPVPFRITTTCGQQKSLDFIRQNKLDNPSSGFGAFMRMFFEVFAFRSLFRNTKAQLKEGRLVYGESKWLWLFAILFHYSFLVIFLRHFRFFVEPVPFFVKLIQDLDGFFQIGVPILYITNGLIFAALFYLFFRRVLDQKVKY
ncbi:MAG: nitrate reductase gamma subunit, partial [Bacteroidota bacterium]|nr:nitrate reductase gamma subunit [Bacteroidota bacterium]